MQVHVLFDSKSLNSELYTGWGVSFLVGRNVLFDTGENGKLLLSNMKRLKVDLNSIQNIIISHNHYDHTSGLWELLKNRESMKVYLCPQFSMEFKQRVLHSGGIIHEKKDISEIEENVYLTGAMKGDYKSLEIFEQSLVIKTKNGVSVICGCAHPGIIQILDKVKHHFKNEDINLVLGGFHLMEFGKHRVESIIYEFQQRGVRRVAPTHCTGIEAEELFKDAYQDRFITVRVGQIIKL